MGGDGVTFPRVERAGRYSRVAEPSWRDPLDGAHSKVHGGRWNGAGSFPVVYLNATVRVARANVARRFTGQPFGPEDLDPAEAPVLVYTSVPRAPFVDATSPTSCAALGLPKPYPLDADGEIVTHEACRPIGQRAWDAGENGIAYRTAADPALDEEELAWFQRDAMLPVIESAEFDRWFWN